MALSDISSDILYEKPAACTKIGLLETMIECKSSEFNGFRACSFYQQRPFDAKERKQEGIYAATGRTVKRVEKACKAGAATVGLSTRQKLSTWKVYRAL